MRAMNHLAYMFKNGLGTSGDYQLAYELYSEAGSAPEDSTAPPSGTSQYRSNALYHLARLYEAGEGVEPSRTKAIECYRKAAALGDSDAKAALLRFGCSIESVH